MFELTLTAGCGGPLFILLFIKFALFTLMFTLFIPVMQSLVGILEFM